MDIDRIVIATCHSTSHDASGNPRRVWVFRSVIEYDRSDTSYREGCGNDGFTHVVFTHDEGYSGRHEAFRAFRSAGFADVAIIDNGSVPCSPADYKQLVKWMASKGET